MTSVGCCRKGSITAVSGSGTRIMSDSWISWKPRMEEPSNPSPSSKASSPNSSNGIEKCCINPGRSEKRRSTNLAPCCSPSFSASDGVAAMRYLLSSWACGYRGEVGTTLWGSGFPVVSCLLRRGYGGRPLVAGVEPRLQAPGLLAVRVLEALDYPALHLSSVQRELHPHRAVDGSDRAGAVREDVDTPPGVEQLLRHLGLDSPVPPQVVRVPDRGLDVRG